MPYPDDFWMHDHDPMHPYYEDDLSGEAQVSYMLDGEEINLQLTFNEAGRLVDVARCESGAWLHPMDMAKFPKAQIRQWNEARLDGTL